jgi:hypothetical protein
VNPILIAIFALVTASEPTPAETAAAELFALAESELAAGHYETALEHLRQADALVPHPATKFHMARCLEELGRLREAWELYGVVAEHAEVSPGERTAAAQARARTRSRLAGVRVEGRPGGQVFLDGELACETPCTALADRGTHELAVVWPEHRVDRRFELSESEVLVLDLGVPAPILPPPSEPAPRDATPPPSVTARWPTAITWVGLPLAGLGAIGTVAFGASTLAVRRDHLADPTEASQTRGLQLRALTNASIAIGLTGGVLLVIDAIRYGVEKRRRRSATP